MPDKAWPRVLRWTGGGLLVIAAVPLLGWATGLRPLTSLFVDRIPVRPLMATAIAAVGLAVRGATSPRFRRRPSWYALAALVIVIGVFAFVATLFDLTTPIDGVLYGRADFYPETAAPIAAARRVPLLGGAALTLLGTALAIVWRSSRAAHLLALAVMFSAYLVLIAELFGAGEFYHLGDPARTPLTTATALAFASIGVLSLVPQRGLLRYLRDPGPTGILVRLVLGIVPLALPLVAWLFLPWHERGVIDEGTVFAMLVLTSLLVMTVILWRAAVLMGRVDRARLRAQRELRRTNSELERRVAERTAEVAAHSALFTSAFESAPVGMALMRVDGTLSRLNHVLVEILEFDVMRDADRTLASWVAVADRASLAEQSRRLREGEQDTCEQRVRLVGAPGSERWLNITATLLPGAGTGQPKFLIHAIDVTDEQQRQEQLQHLADHDPLTGLGNRRYFNRRLAEHVAAVRRYGPSGALLMVDLDHFKAVNDTFGHKVGDQVLVAIAEGLRAGIRATDLQFRLGGDELAVLLQHGGIEEASVVARHAVDIVRTAAAAQVPAGLTQPVTASVGVAVFDDRGASGEDMLRRADAALYEAKDSGRDGWRHYRAPVRRSPAGA